MRAVADSRDRIASLDTMRGVIMVVMALDHTRDYWTNAAFGPTDAEQTTVAYFLTRWVTHLCAPWFMLLAGAGAALSLARRDKASLSRFLVTRGLWLIVLELTVLNVAWKGATFDPTFMRVMILCALGASMIALAGLVYTPRWFVLAFALVLILGHDALDKITPDDVGAFAPVWKVFHQVGIIGAEPGKGFSVLVLYPLVPWLGVMALGYWAAPWMTSLAPERRARTFALLGLALLGAFAIVRGFTDYGDRSPWEPLATSTQTAMSFMDLSKYPPSLDFLLATIGVGLLLLAAIDATSTHWRVFRTYGRVPMFYYLVHVALISGTYELVHRFATGHWRRDDEWGFGLGVVYAAWLAYVVALYPLCRWFEGVKARRRDWWLGYL